jgi:hypothetical protein
MTDPNDTNTTQTPADAELPETELDDVTGGLDGDAAYTMASNVPKSLAGVQSGLVGTMR